MGKTSLGKSDLQKEKQQLKLYLKLLPSLDLKRTQLMAEHARAKTEMLNLRQNADQTIAVALKNLPMLANRDVQLEGLVKIKSVNMGEQSVVGVKVPYLKEITFEVSNYSMFATPIWFETYLNQLKNAVENRMREKIMSIRVNKLGHAVRRITQHVNLFEKILIPTAKKNIQKIQIILNETQRSAVVRSKLAKSLHKREDQANDLMEATS